MNASHAIVLTIVLATAACTTANPDHRAEWNEKLSEAVHAKVGNANSVYLDFDALMPFEWELVFVFPPYTSHEDIFDAIGFRWEGVRHTAIDNSDRVTLLVFVSGRRVVYHIEHPRVEGDFSMLRAGYAYTPEEAYFEIVAKGLDEPWLVAEAAPRGR